MQAPSPQQGSAMVFQWSIWLWELDHKDRMPNNLCLWIAMLEETPESLFDSKESKTYQSKGRSTLKIHWKDWCWNWSSSILVILHKQMTNLVNIFKSRDITLLTKVHLVKAIFFPVVVWIWELNQKESWVPKNWSFWNVVLEKLLRVQRDQTRHS